jgi:hypothetical protein
MADKQTKLSIVIRAVDQATATIRAITARISAISGRLSDGFGRLLGGIRDVIGKLPLIGAAAGAAIGGAAVGLFRLVDGFDELGDKAEAMGVSVDFLAQMRYAAERSGASVEALDSGMQGFAKSLGQARAGTGRMLAFVSKVSPVLARQLGGAKSNEAAFDLLANAMAKLQDPAKKAALAQAAFGDASLAPLLAKGAAGIKELRDRYLQLAGSQKGAAEEAGKVDDSMKDFKASIDGVKAALVQGLSPALKIIVDKLQVWLVDHRDDIKKWAADLGEKLPGAIAKVVEWVGKAYDKVVAFVDKIGGLKNAAILAGGIIAGPLLMAVASLASALVTAGTAMAGLFATGRVAGFIQLITNATKSMVGLGAATSATGKAGGVGAMVGRVALPIAAAVAINEASGGSIQDKARARGWQGEDWDLPGAMKFNMDVAENGRSASDVVAQAMRIIADSRAKSEPTEVAAKLKIDVSGVVRGMRVTADSQGDNVDWSLGQQMSFAP